jgi:hypothetical protein
MSKCESDGARESRHDEIDSTSSQNDESIDNAPLSFMNVVGGGVELAGDRSLLRWVPWWAGVTRVPLPLGSMLVRKNVVLL